MTDTTETTTTEPTAPELAPAPEAPVTPEAKPGYKTTEFWLSSLALILGVVLASGALPETGLAAQIVGGVLSILASLGYTASRTKLKSAGAS